MKRLYLCLTMENIRVLYQKMILLYRIFWNFELHYYVKNYGTMKKKWNYAEIYDTIVN